MIHDNYVESLFIYQLKLIKYYVTFNQFLEIIRNFWKTLIGLNEIDNICLSYNKQNINNFDELFEIF